MSTTRDAWNAGSPSYVWICAIEGYNHLLTDGDPAAAVTAWAADAHYSQALGGLYVDLDNSQELDPKDPFTLGGSLTLRVVKTTDADTFGVDTHKRDAGDETYLKTTIDNDATTITVDSTADFDSSGDAWIGTECFGYSGKTATTFTGCVRGKYTPFAAETTTDLFGHYHRAGTTDLTNELSVNIPVRVTSIPRVWRGKWIGLWAHRIVNGVLDTKAEAHLVYAGRIEEIQDDPSTMSTVISCKHVLDYIAEAAIGKDQWSAKIPTQVYLNEGWRFELVDQVGAAAPSTADDLVVTTGASGTEQIETGYHTRESLLDALNQWFTAQASNVTGAYSIGFATNPNTGVRTKIYWNIPGSGKVRFSLVAPNDVFELLGFREQNIDHVNSPLLFHSRLRPPDEDAGDNIHTVADRDLARLVTGSGQALNRCEVTDEIGTFRGQYASLPTGLKAIASGAGDWGCFLVEGKYLFFGAKSGDELIKFELSPILQFSPVDLFASGKIELPYVDGMPDEVSVKQIFVLELKEQSALMQFLYSTGTAGYNHATHDTLPFGVGLEIPAPLLGNDFEASCAALPGADNTMVAIIDKPTKFADLFSGDLLLRRAFLRWTNQHIEFKTWSTPVTSNATVTLEDDNKAAPAGNDDHHTASTIESSEWAHPIVKVQYNRDATDASAADGFRNTLPLVDAGAIDDTGGEAPMLTIKARNTFAQFANTGTGVESLLADYLVMFPMFARPMRFITRSIAPTMFEQIEVGDVVLVTDSFARDPQTGLRAITTRPGLIVQKRYSPGGAVPGGGITDMGGEVRLLLLDVDRFAPYVPAAQVDDTSTNSGYVVATKLFTCYAHKYSESGEDTDPSHFDIGDNVKIVEIDPADPTSPSTHDDTVRGQVGNTIEILNGFAGFDNAKKYRIVFDTYGDAIASQQLFSYQADDADGMIADTVPPREYAGGQGVGTYTASAAADPVELPPDLSYGDGVGRDTGHEFALARLANNIIDFKSTHQCPVLDPTALVWSSGGTYKLVAWEPVYLTEEILGVGITRSLTVAVWFRSSDGASANVRVRLARTPPTGDTLFDVDLPAIFASGIATSTSTTWATSSDITLDMRVKAFNGIAWLWIEVDEKAQTRGLAKMVETARVIV